MIGGSVIYDILKSRDAAPLRKIDRSVGYFPLEVPDFGIDLHREVATEGGALAPVRPIKC